MANVFPSINLLRMISFSEWGDDPNSLTTIYKAVIKPKMDYGFPLFGLASKTTLNKLEILQNTCLILTIKALPSTPISVLQQETKVPPLQIRRHYLTQRFLIQIHTNAQSSKLQQKSNVEIHGEQTPPTM